MTTATRRRSIRLGLVGAVAALFLLFAPPATADDCAELGAAGLSVGICLPR